MHIVADTNVVVSGLLWNGNERRLMDAARDGIITLVTCKELLTELADVLSRPKFSNRLTKQSIERSFLVEAYSELADIVVTQPLHTATSRDPDDDTVLACAVSGDCEIVVTGDDDLLVVKEYQSIRIMKTAELLAELNL